MKKVFRTTAVMIVAVLATLGMTVASTPTASAQAFGRNRIFHSWLSERSSIQAATEYNGGGHKSLILRGHRPVETAGGIRSVWVPKGCTLVTNGWAYDTAWTKGAWSNIGKYPFVTLSIKMDCGLVKPIAPKKA